MSTIRVQQWMKQTCINILKSSLMWIVNCVITVRTPHRPNSYFNNRIQIRIRLCRRERDWDKCHSTLQMHVSNVDAKTVCPNIAPTSPYEDFAISPQVDFLSALIIANGSPDRRCQWSWRMNITSRDTGFSIYLLLTKLCGWYNNFRRYHMPRPLFAASKFLV